MELLNSYGTFGTAYYRTFVAVMYDDDDINDDDDNNNNDDDGRCDLMIVDVT